jgi:hypothetical protein
MRAAKERDNEADENVTESATTTQDFAEIA